MRVGKFIDAKALAATFDVAATQPAPAETAQ